jgi:hypothetical protein
MYRLRCFASCPLAVIYPLMLILNLSSVLQRWLWLTMTDFWLDFAHWRFSRNFTSECIYTPEHLQLLWFAMASGAFLAKERYRAMLHG